MRVTLYVTPDPDGSDKQIITWEPAIWCEPGPGITEFAEKCAHVFETVVDPRTEEERKVLRAELKKFMENEAKK